MSSSPPFVLTREQCRAVDRYAIEQLGIPGVVLMENAGRNAADIIERLLQEANWVPGERATVRVVCGRGNNGGDGFVIARHLVNRGHDVCIGLAADPAVLTGDAAINFHIVERMGIPLRRVDQPDGLSAFLANIGHSAAIVDALLGTGFAGQVREPLAGVIRAINAAAGASQGHTNDPKRGPLVVAVDVPSGLDADTGVPGGIAVTADATVSFLAAKPGYQNETARPYVGRLFIADIGAPLKLVSPNSSPAS